MNRRKNSLSRRFLAMLLTAVMLITLLPAGAFATESGVTDSGADSHTENNFSKSKTATSLDDEFESKVTLSLPADDEELVSDVLFVLDKSSCSKTTATAAGELLKNLLEEAGDAKIRVGIINFRGTANLVYPLTELTGDQEQIKTIENHIMTQPEGSGTNIEAGLELAEEVLAKDLDASNNGRQHIILVTDGLTRMFNNDNGETMTIFNEFMADGPVIWGNMSAWTAVRTGGDGVYTIPGGNWNTYFSNVEKWVKADGDTYALSYEKYGQNNLDLTSYPEAPYVKYSDIENHALNVDRAVYDAYYAYKDLEKQGYECATVLSNYTEFGGAFVDALNDGETVNFASIEKSIKYLVDKGSYVIDEIGYGKDNRQNDYNFDFIVDENNIAEYLQFKVGDESLNVTIGTPDTSTGETARYNFGTASEPSQYVLEYYKEGTVIDGEEYGECFVLRINTAVSEFAPSQLTYTVKLMNPQTEEGVYGTENLDGSKNTDALYTNNIALLYPVSTGATTPGYPEPFPKPTVSYTVAPKDAVLEGEQNLTITKKVSGDWPEDGVFTFKIAGTNGTILPEGYKDTITISEPTSGSTNKASFGDITYTEPGTYTYTIHEVRGDDANMIYDSHRLKVTVTVADDMSYTVKYTGSKTFTNSYYNGTDITIPDGDDTPDLNTIDHYSYIVGYPEDYRTGVTTDDEDLWPVKPQGNITRAEVATIFYRLLTDEARAENWTHDNDFTDVDDDDWFVAPVATLSAMGIVGGYEDGSFRPNAAITRAEFAAIASRFFSETGYEYVSGTFTDVTGSEWFADALADAYEHGIIGGYPDGSFKPNQSITRAEACSIVNRTLDRIPHEDYLLPVSIMRTWPDNIRGAWYYADMQEATNSHEYEWMNSGAQRHENWLNDIEEIDWDEVERELEAMHGYVR